MSLQGVCAAAHRGVHPMDPPGAGWPGRTALHLHPVHQLLPAAARGRGVHPGLLLEESQREGAGPAGLGAALHAAWEPPAPIPFLPFSQGAFWGLLQGLLLGLLRLLLDFIFPEPRCDEPDTRPGVLKYMHYLYFSMLLGATTTLTVLLVSLATEPPAPQMVSDPPVSLTPWDTPVPVACDPLLPLIPLFPLP